MSSSLPAYSTIYAFGDSLSDAGNISLLSSIAGSALPVSPPYYQEHYGFLSAAVFSNGPVWVQDLSLALGLGTLKPSLDGGHDFAYGGAQTGPTPQNAHDPIIQAVSLPAQLTEFEAEVGKPSADALYTLSIGSNDVLAILRTPGLTPQQQAADVSAAVADEVSFVKSLIAHGATNVLVLNLPDLGKTPDVTSGAADGTHIPSAALVGEASQLSSAYDAALASQLAAVGPAVHVADLYHLLDNAVADPAAYGLSNVTAPVWSGNFSSASSGSLAATGTAQGQYLFWDQLHPTETGQLAIAAAAEPLLG